MRNTLIACRTIVFTLALVMPVFFASALTPTEERKLLEDELKQLEQEINSIEGDITKTQQQRKTLQNDIAVLKNKIKKLDLQISQSTRIIGDLRVQITDTASSIDRTIQDIGQTQKQLGDVLQRMYQDDKRTPVEIVLTGNTLSAFFNNIAALEALRSRNKDLLENMKQLSEYLQTQKGALESEKKEEENFVKIQLLQKQQSLGLRTQNEKLLAQTKGKETEYQKILQDKKKQAQEIRSRIFELIGVPDAPTFGQALDIAKQVSLQTGVRAALVLAVLTQESSLGKNVGQCYMTDPATGNGTRTNGKFVAKVMKPSRDVQPFLTITQESGRDFSRTPVSCPIPSVGGYGGAMGPAQFIPSTWMLYRDRIAAIKGKPGDPWNISDAFLAAALYLANHGAAKQTYTAEWRAAMIYFSGSTNTRYRFYGDSVMSIASRYEEDIKAIENGNGR